MTALFNETAPRDIDGDLLEHKLGLGILVARNFLICPLGDEDSLFGSTPYDTLMFSLVAVRCRTSC